MTINIYDLLDVQDSLPKLFGNDPFSNIQSHIVQKLPRSHSPAHKRRRLSSDVAEPSLYVPSAPAIRINVHYAADSQPRPFGKIQVDVALSSVKKFISETLHTPAAVRSASVFPACRSLVLQSQKGEILYDLLNQLLESRVNRILVKLKDSIEVPIAWLQVFVEECHVFHNQIAHLIGPLTYLDQIYVKETGKLCIQDMAYGLLQSNVLFDDSVIVRDRINQGFLHWLDIERQTRKSHAHRDTIRNLIPLLITHGYYNPLEQDMFSHTAKFFKEESNKLYLKARNADGTIDIDAEDAEFNDVLDATSLLRHFQRRIDEEITRVNEINAFPPRATAVLKVTVEHALLSGNFAIESEGVADWIARCTLKRLIPPISKHGEVQSTLQQEYALFQRVDVLSALLTPFKQHVQSSVQDIVKKSSKDDQMVDRLLELKSLFEETIKNSFVVQQFPPSQDNATQTKPSRAKQVPDSNFYYTMHSSFSTAFKTRRLIPAEQIAKALDLEMRRGQGKSSQQEYTNRLNSILSLYRYSDDKDVFRKFYHRALAKRLLLDRSAGEDEEKRMIKLLGKDYDPEFGVCEGMFKDLSLSRDLNQDFHVKYIGENLYAATLSAVILQQSAWPFAESKIQTVLFPEPMRRALDEFETYYKNKHGNRRLRWDYSLGTVSLKARFATGPKELSVSLYQALVLLLFNEVDKMEYSDIRERLGINDDELTRTLQSLALGKKRVLRKERPGKDVASNDVFVFNKQFTDPRTKVHINSIQAKVTPEESHRTKQSIEGDRKYILEAAIVRIMKGKKELSYEDLLVATIDTVKAHFKPEVDVIKKRIESLVEQDYIERKPGAKNIFLYVA